MRHIERDGARLPVCRTRCWRARGRDSRLSRALCRRVEQRAEHGQRIAHEGLIAPHHAVLFVDIGLTAGGAGDLAAIREYEGGAAAYRQLMPATPALGDDAGLVAPAVPILLEALHVQRGLRGDLARDVQQLVAERGTAALGEEGV